MLWRWLLNIAGPIHCEERNCQETSNHCYRGSTYPYVRPYVQTRLKCAALDAIPACGLRLTHPSSYIQPHTTCTK